MNTNLPLFRLLSKVILLTLFFCCSMPIWRGNAQVNTNTQKPARILFLLDASGSMGNNWQKKETRFHAASRIILSIMDSIYAVNPSVSFALRAFGEQYPASDSNCYDTKLEVPFALQNRGQIEARLAWLQPLGFSPIALSLKQAAEDDFIEDDKYAYSIIMLTDGGETCGGDICATVQNLLKKKISFTPYVLTLIDYQPVRDEYECLGNVLTVAKEKQITPAIHKIIKETKNIISVKTLNIRTNIARPVVVKTPAKPKVVIAKPVEKTPLPTIAPPVEIKPPKTLPTVGHLNAISLIRKPKKANLLFTLPASKAINISTEYLMFAPAEYNKPIMTPSPVKPITTQQVKPTKASSGIRKVDFYAAIEDAKETTLQVFFTNGEGKFYYTEPVMKIIDSKTGKAIKTTVRGISGHNPIPIPLISGVYDIVIPGSKSKAAQVHIQANKNNKIYIKAGMASLAFYYSTQPNKPVKKYKAFVSNRFGQREVNTQNCDQARLYSPANYHIEINTLPKLVYNINLNFNQLKLVAIPTPGTFQVLNTSSVGQAQLWHQLGNAYVPFLNMEISGEPNKQKVDLLPGFYQIRYFKSPKKPYDVSTVVSFRIKSSQTTSVTLEN